MTDVLFTVFNRGVYTRAAFAALVANTDWQQVATLYIADDASTDSTAEWLQAQVEQGLPIGRTPVVFRSHPVNGPVAAMNWYLAHADEQIGRVVKIDNDFVVCPGWLPDLLALARHRPELDCIGIAPQTGIAVAPPFRRHADNAAKFIGGIGMIRHRIFERCQPTPRGRQGWTQWQIEHSRVLKAWLQPPLPCFELDRLPFEPWRTLAADYVARGWQRPWEPYPDDASHLWSWWLEREMQETAA